MLRIGQNMADERSDNGGRMDRNLYLSLPSLPRSESRELGSDLTAVSSVRLWLSPFFHASALYSPSKALSTPDTLPADPLPAVAPAAIYNLHSSSQQPLDEPSTVPNLHAHEPLARETLRQVPLRELVAHLEALELLVLLQSTLQQCRLTLLDEEQGTHQ